MRAESGILAAGAALLGRGRVPPGVLPVLSALAPHRLASPLPSPLSAKAAHPPAQESKPAGAEASPNGPSAAAAAQQQPAAPAKNVFQRAKEMKM